MGCESVTHEMRAEQKFPNNILCANYYFTYSGKHTYYHPVILCTVKELSSPPEAEALPSGRL
jgi:hypothetical protein